MIYTACAWNFDAGRSDFYYLADAFLHGRTWLDFAPGPYDVIRIDGRYYVPFAPFPAIAAVPLIALIGPVAADHAEPIINGLLAAATVGMCWWTVGRLGVSRLRDRAWLTILFGFSTQILWITTRGGVWHTGQLIATLLTFGCLLELWGSRRALLIGLLAGAAFLTRAPLAFAVPFYALLLIQAPALLPAETVGGYIRRSRPTIPWRAWTWLAIGVLPSVVVFFEYNQLRFGSYFESGYGLALLPPFLEQLREQGLFSLVHVPMNFDYLFTHMPTFISTPPFFRPDGLGLSIFLTSPGLLYAVRADWRKGQLVDPARGDGRGPHPEPALLRRRLAAVRLPLFPRFGAVRHRVVRERRGDPRPDRDRLARPDHLRRRGDGGRGLLGLCHLRPWRGRVGIPWSAPPGRVRRQTTPHLDRVPVRILVIFVLSGAAGLIDEIVWSRQLVLVFGNTTQAVSAILTGFFGGMAIGAAVGGRYADRVRRPLRVYGWLEVVLAVVVIVTPITFRLINEVYRGIYPSLEGSPQLLALVRMGLAVLALAPATVLMGATLPTLTRYLTRNGHLSAAFGKLYAANTIGAIVGTLVAGIVLIELFGLTGALAVGAGCSLIAGVSALWLARSETVSDVDARPRADRGGRSARAGRGTRRPAAARPARARAARPHASRARDRVRVGPDVARLPGPVDADARLGDRQHDVRLHGHPRDVPDRSRDRRADLHARSAHGSATRPGCSPPPRSWSGSSCSTGWWRSSPGRSSCSTRSKPLDVIGALVGTAAPVVLLTTIVLGLTFPASSTLLPQDGSHTGRSAGTFLAINTLGAISGSFLVPFLLIPTLGSPHAAALLALVNVVTGAVIALSIPWCTVCRRWTTPIVAGFVGIAIVAAALAPAVLISPNEARCASRTPRSSGRPRTRSRRSKPARSIRPPSCGSPARR